MIITNVINVFCKTLNFLGKYISTFVGFLEKKIIDAPITELKGILDGSNEIPIIQYLLSALGAVLKFPFFTLVENPFLSNHGNTLLILMQINQFVAIYYFWTPVLVLLFSSYLRRIEY